MKLERHLARSKPLICEQLLLLLLLLLKADCSLEFAPGLGSGEVGGNHLCPGKRLGASGFRGGS